jgi:hypothetical protein
MVTMRARHDGALETQLLLQLVAKVKILAALESGVLNLKCPCGAVILPPTPMILQLKGSQRGLIRSRIQHHLRGEHGLSEQTIHDVLKQAFDAQPGGARK